MAVEARAPCGDCNNNKVIFIKITTDFIFYDSISLNILKFRRNNSICKQESAREDELNEDRFITPRQ
jgi:hypothetical protein